MNFLKKLFGTKQQKSVDNTDAAFKNHGTPDNTKLLYYLDNYAKNPTDENDSIIFQELMHGNCFLLMSSVNDSDSYTGWKTLEKGSTLKLTSVYDIDGLQVLGAFTDETSLYKWAKQPAHYVAMTAKDVLEFCQQHNIGRLVINSDQPNMYVLERNSNFLSRSVEEATQVMIGTPKVPLHNDVLSGLQRQFATNPNVVEAFQFLMVDGNEQTMVLGVRVKTVSDNARIAVQNNVANVLEGVHLEVPLDMMFLDDNWYNTVKGMPNLLFYKQT